MNLQQLKALTAELASDLEGTDDQASANARLQHFISTHSSTEASNHQPESLEDWLLHDACKAGTSAELVEEFGLAMQRAGIPIWILWLTLRTLHPQLLSHGYSWRSDESGVEEASVTHSVLQEARYLESPVKPILEGAGAVRRRLDVENPQLDYPIVCEYHEQGATDYVAMPMVFSDGQINMISLTSNTSGGFSTDHLSAIDRALPLLSRLLEVHNMRRTASTLLGTYLGKMTGERVLDGLIKRGDGDDIYAVIWFCDLRESTPLADSMSREDFLTLLNQFYDAMAGAVLEHDGEVLRFIGDAALAIFPIEPESDESETTLTACQKALDAAAEARRRIEVLNETRVLAGLPAVEFGLALHLGEVTYGNIGASDRLEFTVIGAAANEAARIESLCKVLNEKILISDRFASVCPDQYRSLGFHQLKGVVEPHEIFALTEC